MLITYLDLLDEGILLFITFFGAVVTALLTGICFHEASHAFTADKLGDRTARLLGRVSLNPARHLDPTGTAMMMLVGFGWGKPVPVDPSRLRHGPETGRALVAAAGPVSNILIAMLASLPMHLGLLHWWSPFLIPFSVGEWSVADYASLYLSAIIVFNIILAVFNLIPIAPLDGFAVAVGILPRDLSMSFRRLEQYGPAILLVLFFLPFLTNGQFSILHEIMSPLINGLSKLIVGSDDALR